MKRKLPVFSLSESTYVCTIARPIPRFAGEIRVGNLESRSIKNVSRYIRRNSTRAWSQWSNRAEPNLSGWRVGPLNRNGYYYWDKVDMTGVPLHLSNLAPEIGEISPATEAKIKTLMRWDELIIFPYQRHTKSFRLQHSLSAAIISPPQR